VSPCKHHYPAESVMEKWKVVEDYPHYEVSNRGQVRSLSRFIKFGEKRLWVVGRIMKLCNGPGSYHVVTLYKDGRRMFYIHRLVLDAFRGPPPAPGMVCRHLDGDPLNNRISNLVWGTYKENADDRHRHGTTQNGENHSLAKMTDKKVLRIRKLYATGEYTMAAIATAYGVYDSTVHRIIHRRTWKHI